MPVETHECGVCGEYRGEREDVREHVANEHGMSEDEVDEHVEALEDRGI